MARRFPAAQKPDREKYNEAQELDNLQRVFERLDRNGDKKIDAEELSEHLKFLGQKTKMSEVQDMIWEVDEDGDKALCWDEFKTMFYRVRADKSGWEPRKFFNVVEFMMLDKDGSGVIDVDECMELLFRRFGKAEVEAKVTDFMTADEDGDNNITFTEFLTMDKKSDAARMAKHPGFRLSQGILETTRSENLRIMKVLNGGEDA